MILSDDILGTRPDSWSKFLTGVFVLPALLLVLNTLIYAGIYALYIDVDLPPFLDRAIEAIGDEGTPLGTTYFFMTIGIFHLLQAPFIWKAYGRRYISLINPLGQDVTNQIAWAVGFTFIYFVVSEILSRILGGALVVEYQWQPKLWAIWFLPMILVVLLQTSAEEIYVRGFLQQYLARLVPKRWVYIGVPSMLWGLMHFQNFSGIWMPVSFVFAVFITGLVYADWADRSGTIIGPMVSHFCNNYFLTCIYGSSLEPSDLLIWQVDADGLSDEQLAILTLASAMIMALIYLVLRQRIAPRD